MPRPWGGASVVDPDTSHHKRSTVHDPAATSHAIGGGRIIPTPTSMGASPDRWTPAHIAAHAPRPLQSGPMTDTRLWDRAAVALADDGRRHPAVAALVPGMPSVAELFEFMRDAELRFGALRARIIERAATARGEDVTQLDVVVRHPGHAKVTTSRPGETLGADYEIWISDGDLVRTYAAAHKLGTQRPIRNRPRGLHDPDFPGSSQVYEPVTALPMETLPDTFIHPAGFCQNVLATGACSVVGTTLVGDREAILLRCDHPRTVELAGDRPDHRIDVAVDRQLGVILRLVESIGGSVTRDAEVTDLEPDAPLPSSAFDFVFPTGTTMLF
jgi:hypothetical protein